MRVFDDGTVGHDIICGTRRRRERLNDLPADWEFQMMDAAAERSVRLKSALYFLCVSGCRPCEVQHASCRNVRGDLHITIVNAKKSQLVPRRVSQQLFRSLVLSLSGDAEVDSYVRRLAEFLTYLPSPFPWVDVSARKIAAYVNRTSLKAFPSLSPGANCSCFRDQFAADLKSDLVPRLDIAYLMGHDVIETSSVYGLRPQGRAGRRNYIELVRQREGMARSERSQEHVTPQVRQRPNG